jgi:hypothetical protein
LYDLPADGRQQKRPQTRDLHLLYWPRIISSMESNRSVRSILAFPRR